MKRLLALALITASCPAGADAAVLLFTGTSDELWMPLLLFDQYLATHRITAVYLKDFHRLRYLRGIVSLGDDVATTAAALRDFLLWTIDEGHGNDQKVLDPLHFASLPEYVRALSDAQIRKIG